MKNFSITQCHYQLTYRADPYLLHAIESSSGTVNSDDDDYYDTYNQDFEISDAFTLATKYSLMTLFSNCQKENWKR